MTALSRSIFDVRQAAAVLWTSGLVLVFFAPVAMLLAQVDAARLSEVLQAANFPKVVAVTLGTGGASALFAVFFGFAAARQFAFFDWRFKRLWRLSALLPYLVPNFVLASSYVIAWNPASGLLNRWAPLPFDLYGVKGMTLAFAVAHAPVAFLMLEDKLARLDPALREAARLAGASSLKIALAIELPLIVPTLASAFCLAFALAISAFAIPAWIGAPDHAYPLAYKIYQAIQLGGVDGIPDAGANSVVLVAALAPVLLAMNFANRQERRRVLTTGKAGRAGVRRPEGWLFRAFLAGYAAYFLFFFALPVGALALSTLTAPGCLQSSGLQCLGGASLRSYHYVLFELAETRLAFQGSLVYGSISAAVIMFIAVVTLMLLHRAPRLIRTVETTMTLLMATPGAIIALGLIVACSGRFGINFYNTPWIVVLAMVLKHQNLAFQPLATGFKNLGPALTEAARLAGASPRSVWTRIILPILRPECLGAFFLVLVPVLGELTMSIFLSSPSYRSLGTVLFDLQDYADQASAGALAVILVVLVLAANETARLISRGKVGY